MKNNPCTKQTVRVYFSIRHDEWITRNLHQHLASLSDDAARAHAIRQVLFFRKKLESTESVETTKKTIGFKITFSTRDFGLEDLHESLLRQPDEYHRRLIIKKEIAKIYSSDAGSSLTPETTLSPSPKKTAQKINSKQPAKPAQSPNQSMAPVEQSAENSQNMVSNGIYPEREASIDQPKFNKSHQESESESNAQQKESTHATFPEKKSIEFKKLMRKASSSFDF